MATGRKVVAPGQTIESAAWGNPLWDHSVQAFVSAADRGSQFPAPHEGALTYLEDLDDLEVRAAGAWHKVFGDGIPSRQHAGSGVVALVAAASGTVAVTFPVGRFSATPVIVCTVYGTASYAASVISADAAGCDLIAFQRDATPATISVAVNYHATQM